MIYNFKPVTNKSVWEKFNLGRDPKSFLQSWMWGDVNKQLGDKVIRIGIYQDSKLIGLIQLIKQTAKRGPHLIIPAGPIIDWSNHELVRQTFNYLRQLARREGVWFVRLRPESEDTVSLRSIFTKEGLLASPMHLHGENTLIVNLATSEERILAAMRKNTRYDIKKSLTEGYKFRVSNGASDVSTLFELQEQTASRAHFVEFPKKLFEAEVEIFTKETKSFLAVCEKAEPLASAIIIVYGDTGYYHFSGSSDTSRTTRASYFLQWEVIKYLKKLGLAYYDLWGVAPPGKTHHRFAGVTTFKTGFGGTSVNWLHAHDMVISPMYYVTRSFELARKILRGL